MSTVARNALGAALRLATLPNAIPGTHAHLRRNGHGHRTAAAGASPPLIYQHRTSARDMKIADAISKLAQAEGPRSARSGHAARRKTRD
jgi:hypothetical protein